MKKWILLIIVIGFIILPIMVWFYDSSIKYDKSWSLALEVYLYEFGKFLAVTGFIFIFLQYLLSSRIKFIESGIGLDKLIRLHRIFGIVGLILILIHPSALYASQLIELYASRFYIQDFNEQIKGVFFRDIVWKIFGMLATIILILSAGIAILYKFLHKMKYETWKNVHRIIYVMLPLAFVHSVRLGSDMQNQSDYVKKIAGIPALKLIWWILMALYLLVIIYKICIWINIKINPLSITKIIQETHDTWSLYFSGKNQKYKPGQFLIIRLIRKGIVSGSHPFTISSSPTSKELSISIKSVGDFTSTIKDVTTSDKAYIDMPYGVFSFLNHDAKNLVFIAGGIGITPFISMLRYVYDKRLDRNITLIWGNKTSDDIVFRADLDKMIEGMSSLKVVHVMSNQDSWQGEKGHIDSEIIKKYATNTENTQFFVCGPPIMMNKVIKALRELGVSSRKIHYERFAFC